MSDIELTDITGVGPGRAGTLSENGFETVEDIAFASPESISDDTDIAPGTVNDIIENAVETLEEEADEDGFEGDEGDGGDGSDDDAGGRSDGGDNSGSTTDNVESDDGGFTPIEPDELDPFGFDAGASVGLDEPVTGEYLLGIEMDSKTLMHVLHVVLEGATKKEQKQALDFRDYNYRVGRKLMIVAAESGDSVDTTVSMTREEVRALYRDLNQGVNDYSSRNNLGDLWAELDEFKSHVNEIRE